MQLIKKKLRGLSNRISRFILNRKYTFIKLQLISESEKNKINQMGVNLEYLLSNYISFDEQESTYKIPDFQAEILNRGAISSTCPYCGKKIISNQSLPLIDIGYELSIVYRFFCCEEYFLAIGRSPSKRQGIFFLKHKLIVSFEDYLKYPHNHEYYSKKVFVNWLFSIKVLLKNNAKLFAEYCSRNDKNIIVLVGFLNNMAHHLSDELAGIYQVDKFFKEKPSVCLGRNNWFDFEGLFKDLEVVKNYKMLSFSKEDLFKFVLEGNYLAFRATSMGEAPEELMQLIITNSKNKCSKEVINKIKISEKNRPLLWITLRSTVRYWVDEEYALPLIINKLSTKYPNLGVVFDGLSNESEKYHHINDQISNGVEIFNALECEIHETIFWASRSDYFIAPYGNGTIFTTIANKPGFLHTHSEWGAKNGNRIVPHRRENAVKCSIIGGNIVSGQDVFTYNYEIDWEEILTLVLNDLSTMT